MIIIKDTLDFHIKEESVLSLGKFDGIHAGHHLLMQELQNGKKRGLASVVFTFSSSPKMRFEQDFHMLTTDDEKMQILESAGIDYVIECPFNEEIMHMHAEDFLKMLTEKIAIKEIVAGTDFRFGYQRKGDYHLLQACAQKFGYDVKIFQKKQFEGTDISSTRIRELLMKGNVETANELLGYEYFFYGTVVHGNALGRTISAPTANLIPSADKLLPPFGVYASHILLDGKQYNGITNIGKKPTVKGDNPAGVETFIFDFTGNIYGKKIRVSLCRFIRSEMKFKSLEELKVQMEKDIQTSRNVLENVKKAREKSVYKQ